MSTILVNTLTGTTTAGSIAVTGEGNSTTTNLQQGLCKNFCNWDMTGTAEIKNSFNITSLTDNGTGDATLTIANDFSNAFPIYGAMTETGTTNGVTAASAITTGSIRIVQRNVSLNSADRDCVCLTGCGDLA